MREGRAPSLPRRRRGAGQRPTFGLASVALALLFAFTCLALRPQLTRAAGTASAPRPPGGDFADPVVRAVDIDQPAVVRLGTSEHATVAVHLCTRTVALPASGGSYEIAGTGSGAFISANGDILTADHVVEIPDELVFGDPTVAQDVADVWNNIGAYDPGCRLTGGPVTANDVANGFGFNYYSVHASGRSTVVWLSTEYTGPLSETTLSDVPREAATLVASSTFTQDDLAIVHVALTDTPSIPLGDFASVAVDDQLTLIGFPGNGDVQIDPSQAVNPNNFLTSSLNDLVVSAIKTNDNGSPLLQVGGNVEHGDSGGPVLNANGQLVGVVSFGGPDPQGTTAFLRASSTAQNLIQGQGINMTPGTFQVAWTRAFDDYAAAYLGHWQAALRELQALAISYPQFQAITPYLSYAQQAAANEQIPSQIQSTTLTLYAIVGGGALVVLLALAGLVTWLILRRRGRKAPAPAVAVPAYVPYPWYYGPSGGQQFPSPYGYGEPAGTAPGYGPYSGASTPTGSVPPAAQPGQEPAMGAWTPAYRATPETPTAHPEALAERWGSQSGASLAPDAYNRVGTAVTQQDRGWCTNGHRMEAGQMVCPWCGAPRAPATPGVAAGWPPSQPS
jgi:S1-C subfamily serine protease